MLEQTYKQFYQNVTQEVIDEKQRLFDEYLNRQYKGKPWRRLTNEEIIALEDKELLDQIESLSALNGTVVVPEDTITRRESDNAVMTSSDEREITGNQDFIVGHGGDIGGPDGRAYETDEDWARLDNDIATERNRIYRLVTSPPRTAKYLDIFKKKFPNRSEKEIMNGFVLAEDGVNSPDYDAWIERQNSSHKKPGQNRLEHVEVARREAIAPENKDALAYGDPMMTLAIHREVLGNSVGKVPKEIDEKMKENYRESVIAKNKFEVTEGDGFVPEADLIDPTQYRLNGDAIEMPVPELTQAQRDILRKGDLVRGIPSEAVNNG